MVIGRFYLLTRDLAGGKITLFEYFNRIALKIRRTLFASKFMRRRLKIFHPIDKTTIRLRRPEDMKQRMPANPAKREHNGNYSYVAEYKKRIVGGISMSPMIKPWNISNGYMISGAHVDAWYRGFGLGEALYRHIINEAKKEKIPILYQTINISNITNRNLAVKLGFRRTDEELERKLVRQCRMYAYYVDITFCENS